MILVDYSPLLISCAHSACAWEKKENEAKAKGRTTLSDPNTTIKDVHLFRMLNTLRAMNVAYRNKFGKMVICVDRKPYWRNGDAEFPNYKKNRKPMDRSMDWGMFFDNGEDILKAAETVFGWRVIDIPRLEADDSIGTIVHNFHDQEPMMIISPDGDFKQLQIYKNVSQWDTIRKRKITEKYPEQFLRFKIITGDKKDGIPNIMSDPDVFVTEGQRQTSIKNADKETWSKTDPMFFCNQEMLERYRFNEKYLDMKMVPKEYVKKILAEFDSPPPKAGNLYGYFAQKGIVRFLDTLGDFK